MPYEIKYDSFLDINNLKRRNHRNQFNSNQIKRRFFEDRGKPEFSEKNLSEQNSTRSHKWLESRNLNRSTWETYEI